MKSLKYHSIHVISMKYTLFRCISHFLFCEVIIIVVALSQSPSLRIELSLSRSPSSTKVVRLSLSKSASGHRVPTTCLVLIASNSQRDSDDLYFGWSLTLSSKVFLDISFEKFLRLLLAFCRGH